jgi:hypothetical protein
MEKGYGRRAIGNLILVLSLPLINFKRGIAMNQIIYIVGLIVVVLAILSFLGLR